ncbi:MAG: endopeptidase La [Clostridia bacterium]|nr:endopeptidase La [Clostridia bacterium]
MNFEDKLLPIISEIKSPLFLGARVELKLGESDKWEEQKTLINSYGHFVSGFLHNADNTIFGSIVKIDTVDEKNNIILGTVVGRVSVEEVGADSDIVKFAKVMDKPYDEYDINDLHSAISYTNNQVEKLRNINEGNHRFGSATNVDMKDIHGWIDKLAPLFRKGAEKIFLASAAMERLQYVSTALNMELEYQRFAKEFHEKVEESIQENQKEYFLREQLKIINDELYGSENEIEEYDEKIEALVAPEVVRERLDKELRKLANTQPSTPESYVIRNYLDTVLALPWNKVSKENTSLSYARKVLDEDHYGIEKVKERILEFLAVRRLAPDKKGNIICFVGPPGVGKTSIVRSIAKALGREYIRTSLGGMHDEAEIRGHRKTYIGSMIGRIISCIKTVGTMNPVFLLDEIDKLSSDYKGDPASALLEVLDPEQNKAFQDNYLELPFDLSKVLFITTANNKQGISAPLLDRMEIIEMSGYTIEEKTEIAIRHLLLKQLKEHGIKPNRIVLSAAVLEDIICGYTQEAGVRKLEHCIASICRKVAFGFTATKQPVKVLETADVEKYLGLPKYRKDDLRKEARAGVATGLAWTEFGGTTLEIECAIMSGKGELLLTGNLGDVMKESARIALSLVRSLAPKYNIDKERFETTSVHIHAPEGAVPKDGPSAGIALTTAILSAYSGKLIRCDVAVTGEVTLTGRVLPIGGVKEKMLGALQAGITRVILPVQNKKDALELPDTIKNKVEAVFVSDIEEAFRELFV